MTQIFIIDDHPIIRQSLHALMEEEPDLSVCGEAATAGAALRQIGPPLPDLVLIDISLPDMSGIELARMLRDRYPDLPLVMLTGHGERSHVEQALRAGASGYILKGRADELPNAVRHVLRGERYVSAEVGESGAGSYGAPRDVRG